MARSHGKYAALASAPGPLWAALLLIGVLSVSTGCTEDKGDEIGSPNATAGTAAGPPYTDVDLVGAVDITHPEGNPPTGFLWSWRVDGVDSGITDQTVPASATTKSEVWEVSVLVNFGSSSVGPARAFVTVVNKPPEITSLVLEENCDTSTDPLGGTVTAVDTTMDVDGDPTTVEQYFWQASAAPFGVFVPIFDPPIPAADLDTINCSDLAPLNCGTETSPRICQRLQVAARPNDGQDLGDPFTSPIITLPLPMPPLMPATAPGSGVAPAGSVRATGASGLSAAGAQDGAGRTGRGLVAGSRLRAGASPAEDESGQTLERPAPPAGRRLGVSESNVCNVTAAGALDCDGSDEFAVSEPPGGSFFEVAIELDYGCAIRSEDLGVTCWGEPAEDLGQLAAPEGAFTRIDLAPAWGCGLRTSGEIACWGDEALGQTSPPAGAFRDLQLSETYGCAIDADGEVGCWGQLE